MKESLHVLFQCFFQSCSRVFANPCNLNSCKVLLYGCFILQAPPLLAARTINPDSRNPENGLEVLKEQQNEQKTAVKPPLHAFCFPWRGAEEDMQREDLLRTLEALETQMRVCHISAKGTQGLGF